MQQILIFPAYIGRTKCIIRQNYGMLKNPVPPAHWADSLSSRPLPSPRARVYSPQKKSPGPFPLEPTPSQHRKNVRNYHSVKRDSNTQLAKEFSFKYEPVFASKQTLAREEPIRRSHDGLRPAEEIRLPSIHVRSGHSPKMPRHLRDSRALKANKRYSFDEEFQPDSPSVKKKLNRNISHSEKYQYIMAVRTKAGCNAKNVKINQDMDVIDQKLPHGVKMFCICDGHGTNGHHVTAFLKRKLTGNCELTKQENVRKALKNLIDLDYLQQQIYFTLERTNKQLLESEINTELSGSTMIAVFIHKDRLMCFNVGDSRAILINYESNSWKAQQISSDHKPDRKDEASRVIAAGGRIEAQLNEYKQAIGPLRVWMKHVQSPGLAMTRSFGDKTGLKAGTIGEPEVTEFTIQPWNKYLLIASDGVWEHLQNYQIVKHLSRELKEELVEEAADKLLQKAIDEWEELYAHSRDDITFVLVKLNPFLEQFITV